MDADDAQRASIAGADAIIVSNHGGRQLDGALSSIRALEPVVEAVGDKVEIHLDSGIRSGQDILKALALGAKGVMIGRAMVYGLGAMGKKGVSEALLATGTGPKDRCAGRSNRLLYPIFDAARTPYSSRPCLTGSTFLPSLPQSRYHNVAIE